MIMAVARRLLVWAVRWVPIALLALAVAACSSTPAEPTPSPEPTALPTPVEPTPAPEPTAPPPPVVRSGQEVFAATCAACHGESGEGQPNWHIRNENGTLPAPPLNGDGHTWHHADGLLYRIVSQGGKFQETPEVPSFKSAMPAFGELLSHEEIVATLEYVKSLWGDKIKRGLSIRESQRWLSEGDPYPAGGG